MMSPKAVQVLINFLFVGVVTVGLFFLLSRQLAPLLEEMGRASQPSNKGGATTVTASSPPPATLTAMNEVLAAPVAALVAPTTTVAAGAPVAPAVNLTPSPVATAVMGMVNESMVNLRSGPGTSYAVVGQAQESMTMALTGRDATGTWWRICCPPGASTESWISADFVDTTIGKEQAFTLVPVVTAAPPPMSTASSSLP